MGRVAEHDVITVIQRLKAEVERELRAYPYPITACDVAFKLIAEQRSLCRVVLAGLAGDDGLTPRDAREALCALLATPAPLSAAERSLLTSLAVPVEATH